MIEVKSKGLGKRKEEKITFDFGQEDENKEKKI